MMNTLLTSGGATGPSTGSKKAKKKAATDKGVQVCAPGLVAWAYRNGPDGTVETTSFDTGFIPKGWQPSPAGLENFSGWKTSTVVRVRRLPDGKWG